jgi:hypothetical protein
MYLKDLKNMLNDMPEGNEEEIINKLLIAFYVLQPPLNISLSGIVLNLKKPLIDINNYFILRSKSWVFHINKKGEKKIIKYNKIHNPEIYRLLKLSYEKNERLYLFNLNEKELNNLFKKITRDILHFEVSIYEIPALMAHDLINSHYFKIMSSYQKEQEHKKILGYSINKKYAKINLVEFS